MAKTASQSRSKEKNATAKPVASDLVRMEWLRRVQAEYRSAAITHHLTLWLIQAAAPPQLIEAGLRIVKDELVHARMSHRVYTAAGGSAMPVLSQETLALSRPREEALLFSVARSGVEIFCLGETVAVPLFKVLREGCSVSSARRALDRILRDEVRHRDFGWTLLDWLFSLPIKESVYKLLQAELPQMWKRLKASYAPPHGARVTAISPADRAWGLMPPVRYADILQRTVDKDYVPRFAVHGIDARSTFHF